MSKIGAKSITIKEGVRVSLTDGKISVEGSKGNLFFSLPKGVGLNILEDKIEVTQKIKNDKISRALFGLTRAMVANMITGVSDGFDRRLELAGVGYRAQVSGNDLIISVGFSHPVKVVPLEGIKFAVEDNNIIVVSGIDKTLVGNTAATIRAIKPPEPYKGKGIKYKGEKIRRKVGKAAKAVGAK
jgi:large subunit ribosomal protein L6